MVPAQSVALRMASDTGDCVKLILAVPTYGPVDPDAARKLRAAIMYASRRHEWLGDASPDRQPYAAARNNVVHSVIHNDDYPDDALIAWVDSDVMLPIDSIARLADHGLDFVTGIYFQRHPPHRPLIAHFNGKSFQWAAKWPRNVIAPMDGCGFGCVLTSLGMLRKMDAPWFEYLKFSEDFDFCLKAAKLGFQLYVDTAVLCGHLMDPEPATIDTYVNANPEFKLEVNNDGTVRSLDEKRNMGFPEEQDSGRQRARESGAA